MTCGVSVHLCGGSLQVEASNAGGRRKLSPGRVAFPAAAGGRRTSERPGGTPATVSSASHEGSDQRLVQSA